MRIIIIIVAAAAAAILALRYYRNFAPTEMVCAARRTQIKYV